jgi:toxin ParE1/3/4
MIFKVIYLDRAKQDLKNIYDHIANVFVEPVTAEKQVLRIKKRADSLDVMPFGYRVFDKEPWKSQGVRFFPVDKFLVFYIPDELQKIVKIIAIIHGTVNIENHLPKEN